MQGRPFLINTFLLQPLVLPVTEGIEFSVVAFQGLLYDADEVADK